MYYGFDVVGLGEEVEAADSIDSIAAGEEFFEIAREGWRVAGNVGDRGGMEIEDAFDHC